MYTGSEGCGTVKNRGQETDREESKGADYLRSGTVEETLWTGLIKVWRPCS